MRKDALNPLEGAAPAALPPLSIYLHWPWCVRKCPYCDFNSHRMPAAAEDRAAFERAFVEGVMKDLVGWGCTDESVFERPVQSIFIGGGTPSLMSGAVVQALLERIGGCFRLTADCEVTMEANPGTAEAAKFAAFREAGVNRLSIGVQSFNDEKLRRLGRIHSADDARRAIAMAAAHFDNFNLDLMYALPGESMSDLRAELEEAVSSGATHLSCYQLTIEPGTAFAKRIPEGLPDIDETAEMGDVVKERLARAGFRRYEVSGYAQEGRRCRHNLNYWTFGDYLAAGPGAHGKLSHWMGDKFVIRREARWANPRKWLQAVEMSGSGIEEAFDVELEDRPFEFMLNALRLLDGVPARFFTERTGLALAEIAPQLERLRREGLLINDPERIAPTRRGLDFLSDVQEAFL